MGTNYYLHEFICPTCGRTDEGRHIGKSSGGWCFGLHVYPEEGINDLADWEKRWATREIRDEYGCVIPPAVMADVITNRNWSDSRPRTPGWYSANYSEPGPNGLARHLIGHGCIGHGEGTWDLIVGEFS